MSRRRALMAASQPSGGDIYLTLNTTNEDNIKAFQLIDREKVLQPNGWDYDWLPSKTNIYVSGTANGVTFTNALVKSAWIMGNVLGLQELFFDGMNAMGGTPVCFLWSNGLLEAYDDD